MTEHTKECKDRTEKQEKLYNEWVTKFPNYCQICFGAGIISWWEQIDEYGGFEMRTVCGCHDEFICSRCGEEIKDEDWFEDPSLKPSPCCGWTWRKSVENVCPEQYPYAGDMCPCQELEAEINMWQNVDDLEEDYE